MRETKQTTIRFSETIYQRMAKASDRTGLTINSLVIIACLDWLRHHENHLILWQQGAETPHEGE